MNPAPPVTRTRWFYIWLVIGEWLEAGALAGGEYDCLHGSVVTAVSKIDLDQDPGQVVAGIAIAIGSR